MPKVKDTVIPSCEESVKDIKIGEDIVESALQNQAPSTSSMSFKFIPPLSDGMGEFNIPVDQFICVPPKVRKRNEFGLLNGVHYIFNENGSVDWRKMIPNEYLYINSQALTDTKRRERFESKYQKAADTVTVEEADDCDLVILLAGIKYLADLRGYLDVSYRPISCSGEYAAIVCKIVWRANYETEGRELSFESTAGTNTTNTDGFGRKYLMEMAENRAFNRAVRNFLKINIVSQQEIVKTNSKTDDEDDGVVSPYSTLKRAMVDKNVTFERIKAKLVEEKVDGAQEFQSINDIPKSKIMSLISRIRGIKGVN